MGGRICDLPPALAGIWQRRRGPDSMPENRPACEVLLDDLGLALGRGLAHS